MYDDLLKELFALCAQNNISIVSAESCTGGLIAQSITSIAGSSSVFERGFVTYSNEAKQDCLSVSGDTLAQHGAVSTETAKEMAEGALKNSRATISIATTGIAGPTGGSVEKPVGLVCFGLAATGKDTQTNTHVFTGDRNHIQQEATRHAINMLIQSIKGY